MTKDTLRWLTLKEKNKKKATKKIFRVSAPRNYVSLIW